jgi:predicted ArsR family transcriptional regulator
MTQEHERILKALEDDRYVWRTAEGIATELSLSPEQVRWTLNSLVNDVVVPNARSSDGKQLYGSRKRLLKHASVFTSISGSFNNRIY